MLTIYVEGYYVVKPLEKVVKENICEIIHFPTNLRQSMMISCSGQDGQDIESGGK